MELTEREELIYEKEVLNGTPVVSDDLLVTHFFCEPSPDHPTSTLIFHEATNTMRVWCDEYVNEGDAQDRWLAITHEEHTYVADN